MLVVKWERLPTDRIKVPSITFTFDGRPVTLDYFVIKEHVFYDNDAVYLGDEFEESLPEITIRVLNAKGEYQPLKVRGYTRDPDVVSAVRDYLEAVSSQNFEEGERIYGA